MTKLCSEDTLKTLVQKMQSAPSDQLGRIEALLADFPEDARLHLLRGTTLLGNGRLIEGHRSLTRAVEIAPDFAIARFQLGLFQLTSGEAENALETWGRLDRLPDGHYLRGFVDGLRCLIRDDFGGAIQAFREGIRLNSENEPLNRDMQLLVDRCLPLIDSTRDDDDAPISETTLILKRFAAPKNAN
jgi:tetratricopeptide (TPR) repeat protein